MMTINDIQKELEIIGDLQHKVKLRSMIYQVSEKERKAIKIGLPVDSYFNLPYKQWKEVRDASDN